MDRLLVLARHGQSEWNLKNLFTGWRDPGLTDLGVEEARTAGRRLKAMGVRFDIAFRRRPALRASSIPRSVSPGSFQPVNRFLRFHSLWPWRARTRRRFMRGGLRRARE